jgi:hypothetical protein
MAQVNIYMEPSDCDEIPLCKIRYFVIGTALLAEYSRCGRTVDHKMVAMQGSLCAPTALLLKYKTILISRM